MTMLIFGSGIPVMVFKNFDMLIVVRLLEVLEILGIGIGIGIGCCGVVVFV